MKYLHYIVIGVVAVSVCVGLYFAGSPNRARALRFDDRRINDITGLQNQILWHWQTKKALPKDLAALAATQPGYETPTDPETKQAYEYHLVNGLSFELCATFALPTQEDGYNRYSSYAYPQPYFVGTVDWKHDTGRTCFARTIDQAQYEKDQAAQLNMGIKPVPVY